MHGRTIHLGSKAPFRAGIGHVRYCSHRYRIAALRQYMARPAKPIKLTTRRGAFLTLPRAKPDDTAVERRSISASGNALAINVILKAAMTSPQNCESFLYLIFDRRIKRGPPNLLAKPLALITRWCQHQSLPALASLVVEQATGLPAPGFAAVSRDQIPREQERVWAFDWYAIFPPTIEELVEN
jgi:hypothetical protein